MLLISHVQECFLFLYVHEKLLIYMEKLTNQYPRLLSRLSKGPFSYYCKIIFFVATCFT